jgi:pimeloyl-ACP methyl ester carboxylesterase
VAGDGILKKIIRYISIIGIFLFLLQPMIGNAGALEEYEEAHTLYLAAVACTAAYSDRVGEIARDALEQNGWEIQSYVGKSRQADARFFVAKKIPPGSTIPVYLFSVVGTENMKDVKTDLRVDKVYFAGKNPEEFLANAQLKNMPNTVPKVHKGFNQYVQAGLATEVMEEESNSKKPLLDMLLENKDRKVYLVGHSLGGAAVTLGGARLLDMGVKPEQIEVITFGAPAVGNKAFRDKFEPALHLTRIVATGDPITGALQQLVGGYEQFGHEIRWQTPGSENAGPHDITLYLDLAIKNYYDKRQKAVLAGELSVPDQARGVTETPRVYVAPIKNNLPADLQNEFIYMKEALQDEYRSAFPGYVLDMGEDDKAVFQKAIDAQCEWVVMPKVEAHKAKNEDNVYYITLEQSVYRADSGAIFNTASYGSSTRTLTSLEALIHDAKNMSSNKHEWLASANKKN